MYGALVYDEQLLTKGLVPYKHFHATSLTGQMKGHNMEEFKTKKQEMRYGREVTLVERGIFCPKCHMTLQIDEETGKIQV